MTNCICFNLIVFTEVYIESLLK